MHIRLPPFPTTALPAVGHKSINLDLYTDWTESSSSQPSLLDVQEMVLQDLDTAILNQLHDHLWFVGKKSHSHIDAIHQHVIKERSLIVAEDSALHMVWYYKTVYLKPIPRYLLSYTFWERYLLPSEQQRSGKVNTDSTFDVDAMTEPCRAALGFLRSYSYLIVHDSDFQLARQVNLIPKDTTSREFRLFIGYFRSIPDAAVTPRYHYGQLRLTRLNLVVRLLQPRSLGALLFRRYHQGHMQTGQYIQRFGTPLLFLFAANSLILSAMQVTLAALGNDTWHAFVKVSRGFSVGVIVLILNLAFWTLLGIVAFLLYQGQFALRMRKRDNQKHKTASIDA